MIIFTPSKIIYPVIRHQRHVSVKNEPHEKLNHTWESPVAGRFWQRTGRQSTHAAAGRAGGPVEERRVQGKKIKTWLPATFSLCCNRNKMKACVAWSQRSFATPIAFYFSHKFIWAVHGIKCPIMSLSYKECKEKEMSACCPFRHIQPAGEAIYN